MKLFLQCLCRTRRGPRWAYVFQSGGILNHIIKGIICQFSSKLILTHCSWMNNIPWIMREVVGAAIHAALSAPLLDLGDRSQTDVGGVGPILPEASSLLPKTWGLLSKHPTVARPGSHLSSKACRPCMNAQQDARSPTVRSCRIFETDVAGEAGQGEGMPRTYLTNPMLNRALRTLSGISFSSLSYHSEWNGWSCSISQVAVPGVGSWEEAIPGRACLLT